MSQKLGEAKGIVSQADGHDLEGGRPRPPSRGLQMQRDRCRSPSHLVL